MCSCSEKSLETVDKSTQFPYYSISNGVIVKVTNDATLSTKSSECEYYTLSAPEYPDAEPIIVEINEVAKGLYFVNHYCSDGSLIAEFKYAHSRVIECYTTAEFSYVETKANGLRHRGEGYLSCIKRAYHDYKEQSEEVAEIICDILTPICEAVSLYGAVIGCGYYDDENVI